MGYLIKSSVIDAIEEDMQDTMMCYEGQREKDIIAFCYESMKRVTENLPQYRVDNVVEEIDLTPDEIFQLKERDTGMPLENIWANKKDNGHLIFGTCPNCGRRVSNVEGGNFCQNCGQRLKWEER